MFGLEPDISFLDCRIKSGNDRGEEKHGNDNIFSSVILGQAQRVPGIFRFPGQAGE